MILFVNACVRKDSRTERLAKHLLERLGDYTEVKLSECDFKPLDEARLNARTERISKRDYTDPMFDAAKQFAEADEIVIAAPFWDCSFPALLKTYLENIYVTGLVSKYGPGGRPVGLCKAGKLWYVTTAGGPFIPDFSFTYVKTLAGLCFGIPEAELVKAEMLDVEGFNPETILKTAETELDERFREEGN